MKEAIIMNMQDANLYPLLKELYTYKPIPEHLEVLELNYYLKVSYENPLLKMSKNALASIMSGHIQRLLKITKGFFHV